MESGNKYSVSTAFHSINGELILRQIRQSPQYSVLSAQDRARLEDISAAVFMNAELRNRNPLHPAVVDSCVIGNLLNFPKHIFCFPFASYGTDGYESLSLCMYAPGRTWHFAQFCACACTACAMHTTETGSSRRCAPHGAQMCTARCASRRQRRYSYRQLRTASRPLVLYLSTARKLPIRARVWSFQSTRLKSVCFLVLLATRRDTRHTTYNKTSAYDLQPRDNPSIPPSATAPA